MEIINTRLTESEKVRNVFMRKVSTNVWTRLNDVGIDYTFGEIRKHFINMMENPEVQEEVENVFYDRFISV